MAADSVVALPRLELCSLPLPEVPHRGVLPTILVRRSFYEVVVPDPLKLESSRSAPVNHTADDLSTDDEIAPSALADLGLLDDDDDDDDDLPRLDGSSADEARTDVGTATDCAPAAPTTIDLDAALANSSVSAGSSHMPHCTVPAGSMSAAPVVLLSMPVAVFPFPPGAVAGAAGADVQSCSAPAASASLSSAGVVSAPPASTMLFGHLAMLSVHHSQRFPTHYTSAQAVSSAQPIAPLMLPPVLPSGFANSVQTQRQSGTMIQEESLPLLASLPQSSITMPIGSSQQVSLPHSALQATGKWHLSTMSRSRKSSKESQTFSKDSSDPSSMSAQNRHITKTDQQMLKVKQGKFPVEKTGSASMSASTSTSQCAPTQRGHAGHVGPEQSIDQLQSSEARATTQNAGSKKFSPQGDQPLVMAPQVPHFTHAFSIDSSVFRVHWTLHGKTLSDKTKQAVSPAFLLSFGKDFENVAFKLMLNIYSKQSAKKKTFKETEGKGRVQLKCEAELASNALPVRFKIGAGIGEYAEPSRNEVQHNFSQSAVAALPLEQDEFDFKKVLDPTTNTFTIRLEILPHC